jgi:transcriptional regulator with XRE-family HTH domain
MNGILDTHTLRTMREAKGWDQATLAREAGVDQSVISRLERGIQGDLRALLATPYPYEPATLSPELARVVADLAQLEESQQRHVAGILRAYILGLPQRQGENPS